jgi:hypothetical protein
MPEAARKLEVEVLTPEQKAQAEAEMIWNENPEASLPDLVKVMRERVADPTERNRVLKYMVGISRRRMGEFLEETEFDPTAVLARVNEKLDPLTDAALEPLKRVG